MKKVNVRSIALIFNYSLNVINGDCLYSYELFSDCVFLRRHTFYSNNNVVLSWVLFQAFPKGIWKSFYFYFLQVNMQIYIKVES